MAKKQAKANSGSSGRNPPTRSHTRVDRGGPKRSEPVPNPVITRLTTGVPLGDTRQRRKLPKAKVVTPGETVAEEAADRGFRMPEHRRRYHTD